MEEKRYGQKKFIELYKRQKESGITVREFCSNEIIAPSTFYYWQKKLRINNRMGGFIPLVIHEQTKSDHPASPGPDMHVEIVFPYKTIVRLIKWIE